MLRSKGVFELLVGDAYLAHVSVATEHDRVGRQCADVERHVTVPFEEGEMIRVQYHPRCMRVQYQRRVRT